MSITNYTELQTAVLDFMARNELTGNVADFITLAEARLNRELGAVEVNDTITAVTNVNAIDVTSLSVVEPLALLIAQTGFDEIELTPKVDGTYPRLTSSGMPRYFSLIDQGTSIVFDRAPDTTYPMRFRFRQRFALSALAPTNWLLTNHPDIYLAACIVWGNIFIGATDKTAFYKAVLDDGMPSLKNTIARQKRAVLTVDPMLQCIGRRVWGNQWANE